METVSSKNLDRFFDCAESGSHRKAMKLNGYGNMDATLASKETAPRILRLDWLGKQAQTYRELGEARGNMARMSRAVRLEIAAHSQSMAIVMLNVTTYRD